MTAEHALRTAAAGIIGAAIVHATGITRNKLDRRGRPTGCDGTAGNGRVKAVAIAIGARDGTKFALAFARLVTINRLALVYVQA